MFSEALPQVIFKNPLRKNTLHASHCLPFPLCLISGIFKCEPGQSFCRWSQHFRISDRQPWERDCAAVHAALGAPRWKRIPRSPKHSSEGTRLCKTLYCACRIQWSSLLKCTVLLLPSPICLCHSLILPPLTSSTAFALHLSKQSIYW